MGDARLHDQGVLPQLPGTPLRRPCCCVDCVLPLQEQWEAAGEVNESKQVFNLAKFDDVAAAVKNIIQFLGMDPCDKSDKARPLLWLDGGPLPGSLCLQVPAKKTKHVLFLSGVFLGGVPALVRARLRKADGEGVDVELTVRSGHKLVSDILVGSMA